MRTLTPVFISYDNADRSFVKLLQKLLEHEGIESWFDRERTAAREKHKERVQLGLEQARSLIVVVSAHALSSAWVRAEIEVFRMRSPEAMIVPLVLDSTRPEHLDPCLADYPAIDMCEDLLAGFVELFGLYSRVFLAEHARAVQENRRIKPDRRTNLRRRLRVGLWQQLSHTTGLGKFDTIDLARHARAKLVAALHVELAKYELHDQSKRLVETSWALSHALTAIEPQLGETKAVYVIEKLASYLHQHFEVRLRDRRESSERPTQNVPHRTGELAVES